MLPCSVHKDEKRVLKSNFKMGFNHPTRLRVNGCLFDGSIHAEVDACNKLPMRMRRGDLLTVNLIVIRVTKSGKLCNSIPCQDCIRHLAMNACAKGYRIKYVYYSTAEDQIIRETFKHMKARLNLLYRSKGTMRRLDRINILN